MDARQRSPPTPRRTPAPVGRRVRFSENSEMVYVADLSALPERRDIWFTPDELDAFKSNVHVHVRSVRLQIANGRAPSASLILGLEKFLTQRLTDEYRHRRERLLDEVVGEARWQEEQILRAAPSREVTSAHLDFFADRLAESAAERSKWARERARAAALFLDQDQEAEREEARWKAEGRPSSLIQPARQPAGTHASPYARGPGRCDSFARTVSPSHG